MGGIGTKPRDSMTTNSPEKQREYYAQWVKKHPRKVKEKTKKSNDQQRFGGMKEATLHRDNHQCVKCGQKEKLTVDHIDHNRQNNKLTNLQTLCLSCHGRKDGQARKIKSGWKWRNRNEKG